MPKRTVKTLCAPFEVKALDAAAGRFSGYGSVFDAVDSYGEVVDPGAFDGSLGVHAGRGTKPAMLWQHDAREPIGVWEEIREDDRGLYVEGRLLVDADPLARRAYAHLDAGSIDGLSIGFMPVHSVKDDESGIIHLTEVDLWEVSVVTFPANDEARVQEVRAVDWIRTVREFESVLRDELGFTVREAKKLAAGGWPALQGRDDSGGEALEAVRRLAGAVRSVS